MSPTVVTETQPYGLQSDEIAILYPRSTQIDKNIIRGMVNLIQEFAPCTWLSEKFLARAKIRDPGVKIQTVASSKGLQYRAIILIFSDVLPVNRGEQSSIERDTKLLYVALTRPEDFLMVTYSQISPFIEIMLNSGSIQLADPLHN